MVARHSTLARRDLLRGTATLAAAVTFAQRARAQADAAGLLSPEQVAIIEAVGDTLLPGSAAAGLSHFIDAQLQRSPDQALLTVRYLDVSPPYEAFYVSLCAALDGASRLAHGKTFATLDPSERITMVKAVSAGDPPGWNGPPAPLAYFVLRSDALDVVYGTIDGYRLLDIPYLPHIAPEQRW